MRVSRPPRATQRTAGAEGTDVYSISACLVDFCRMTASGQERRYGHRRVYGGSTFNCRHRQSSVLIATGDGFTASKTKAGALAGCADLAERGWPTDVPSASRRAILCAVIVLPIVFTGPDLDQHSEEMQQSSFLLR
jgi:hypothetical protein